MTHDEYVEATLATAQQIAVKGVMSALVKRIPFLGWAFINPLVGFVVTKVITMAIRETEVRVFFYFTDLRVGRQAQAYEAAALANRQAQISGTPEEKARAEEMLINALRNLAKFTT